MLSARPDASRKPKPSVWLSWTFSAVLVQIWSEGKMITPSCGQRTGRQRMWNGHRREFSDTWGQSGDGCW